MNSNNRNFQFPLLILLILFALISASSYPSASSAAWQADSAKSATGPANTATKSTNKKATEPPKPMPPAYVVMVSVDGMVPDYYLKADLYHLKIPNLRLLCKQGSYAEAVETIYPSLTYPSHTTLVTGVRPVLHGISANRIWVDPLTSSSEDWYWYSRAIKTPTLWSEAHKANLKTAAIGWPVTAGAEIDYNFPEIWQAGSYDTSLKLGLENGTPGLADKVFPSLAVENRLFDDELRTQASESIIKQFKPNLTLIHLVELDTAEHKFGPFSTEAFSHLEEIDAQIGRIIDAVKQAGISDQTTIAIVSDHGFMKIEKEFHPAVAMAKAGFIDVTKDGKLQDWRALPYGEGGSTAIMLKKENDRITEFKLVEMFEKLALKSNSPIYRVIKRDEIMKLGANPNACCFLEAAPGYTFTSALTGSLTSESKDYKGAHGYLPTRPEMFASLIISGRGIQAGRHEPSTKSIHIAPTLAALLGFLIPDAEGKPIRQLLTVAVPKKPKDAATGATGSTGSTGATTGVIK